MDTNLVEIARLMAGNQERTIPFEIQVSLIVIGFALGIAVWVKLMTIEKIFRPVRMKFKSAS